MNIAYFTDILSLHGFNWIRHFAERHKVTLFCEKEPGRADWYDKAPNVEVLPVLPTLYPLRNILLRKNAVAELRRLMEARKIDVAHSMYAMPYVYWPWHLRHPRHIATTRGSDMLIDYKTRGENAQGFRSKLTHRLLDRQTEKALNHAQFITCTSEKQIAVVKTFVRDHGKIHLIRTGTDAESFLKFSAEAEAPAKNETLLFSSRALHPHCNIHLLVEALALLRARRPAQNIRLLTIDYGTDAPYAAKVRETISQLKLQEAVDIVPMCDRKQLAAYYKRARLAVMAPFTDGTPVSGIEAQLARTPLLLPAFEYDQTFFNDAQCWSFEAFNAESIAAAVEKILDAPQAIVEEKTRAAFRAAAEHADFKKEMAKVEALYEQLLRR